MISTYVLPSLEDQSLFAAGQRPKHLIKREFATSAEVQSYRDGLRATGDRSAYAITKETPTTLKVDFASHVAEIEFHSEAAKEAFKRGLQDGDGFPSPRAFDAQDTVFFTGLAELFPTMPPLYFPGIEYNGVNVHNPTATNDGRIANPEAYGFEVCPTGGGCTAWAKAIPGGMTVMLTDLGGLSHELPGLGEHFLVGLHLDTEQLGIWTMRVGETYDKDNRPLNEDLVRPDGSSTLPKQA